MILYSGFNGFGQWPESNYIINNFTALDLDAYGINNDTINKIDFYIGWAYNVVNINSRFIMKGFVENEPNKSELIDVPIGMTFTNIACTGKYILFYNTESKLVWKYYLDNRVEQRLKRLPNFIDIEQSDSASSKNEDCIKKIVCGSMINIALTTEGRVFNIPSEISTTHCIGKIIDISCGHEHGILLTDQGNVYTWGGGSRCQLGHGFTESSDTPELVHGLAGIKIVKVASGGWHNCAISSFGDLYTWGWNDRGQLGLSTKVTSNSVETNDTNCDSVAESTKPIEIAINNSSQGEPKNKTYFNPTTSVCDVNSSRLKCSVQKDNNKKNYHCKDIKTSSTMDNETNELISNEQQYDTSFIDDNFKRKKLDCKSCDNNNDIPLINYAVPMLIDICDSKCNVLEFNIIDVVCGSKHTLIKLENDSIWGSGCNKYGQLGLGSDTPHVSSFRELPVHIKDGAIHCGTWASLITSIDK